MRLFIVLIGINDDDDDLHKVNESVAGMVDLLAVLFAWLNMIV